MKCQRSGCNKAAHAQDPYCSTYCCRHELGTLVSSGLQAKEPGDYSRAEIRARNKRQEDGPREITVSDIR